MIFSRFADLEPAAFLRRVPPPPPPPSAPPGTLAYAPPLADVLPPPPLPPPLLLPLPPPLGAAPTPAGTIPCSMSLSIWLDSRLLSLRSSEMVPRRSTTSWSAGSRIMTGLLRTRSARLAKCSVFSVSSVM